MKQMRHILMAIGIGLFLIGCAGEDLAGDTRTKDKTEGASENEVVQEEAKLEIVQSTGSAWVDSKEIVKVHSSAIFENTGNVPVNIGETQMNFKDHDGGILGTSSRNYAIPEIVKPGEKSFITATTTLDGTTDPTVFAETTFNYSFEATEEDPVLLEVSGVRNYPISDDDFPGYIITGIVKNSTQNLQEDIRLAAALLAEDGTLLGVLSGSVDVGINSGDEAGFELSFPKLPATVGGKLHTVEVKAVGWN